MKRNMLRWVCSVIIAIAICCAGAGLRLQGFDLFAFDLVAASIAAMALALAEQCFAPEGIATWLK